MKSLKELFSDTIIYGISSVLARFLGYLLVPFHTGVFDPQKYGVVGLVYTAIALFNVFFTMGMESSYIRYGKDRQKAADYFKTIQLFLLGSSLVLMLIVWLLKPWIGKALSLDASTESIYAMMLGILFFDTLSVVPFAELRLVKKAWLFAGVRTFSILINLGLNFYLILGLNMGLEAVFISNLIASGLTAVLVWLFTLNLWKGDWSKAYLQKAMTFGLPFVPAGIGFVINEGLDRFFLSGMSSETIDEVYSSSESAAYFVGIYNANYKLAVFMLLLVQMFRMAWQPFFMRESDKEDAPELFARVFSYFNIAAAVIFLGVSLFAEQIVSIKIPVLDAYLIGEEYWIGLQVVPVLLMAYWFQGWYVNFSAGIFISETTKRLAQITLTGAAVTVILNLILIPELGMMGSALATLFSYLSMAMLIYYYSNRFYKVPYQLLQGFAVVIVTGAAVLIKAFLSDQNFSQITLSALLFAGSLTVVSIINFGPRLFRKKG